MASPAQIDSFFTADLRDVCASGDCTSLDANSVLWKLRNRGVARQDNAYRWFAVDERHGLALAQDKSRSQTALARLCRYYLECLSLDDEAGVRLFAKSQFSLDYVEAVDLSLLTGNSLNAYPGVDDLFRRLQTNRERKVPYVGYPVRLKWIKGRGGWEGFMLEPVFLFSLNDGALGSGDAIRLSDEAPTLNFSVIRSLAVGNEGFVLEEAAKLAEELGLGEPDAPDFDEVIDRLVRIREDWDWKEPIDPHKLSGGTPLSNLDTEGIYNRCIIFGCERSPYTKGLEQELLKLQDFSDAQFRNTALGMMLERKSYSAEHPSALQALLQPLPLNTEQTEAIEKALTRPLTVVTGPPGTGKSQVVSSLLINAAKMGKRVLFASKNNKAVDVVETRVNALGPRPILLRLGRGEYQTKLTEYLTGLLASRATEEDQFNFAEAQKDFNVIVTAIADLQRSAGSLIDLRNEVDAAERRLHTSRVTIGDPVFASFRGISLVGLKRALKEIEVAVSSASKGHQGFVTKLLWFARRKERFDGLYAAIDSQAAVLQPLNIPLPSLPTNDAEVPVWCDFVKAAGDRLNIAQQVNFYFQKLDQLSRTAPLEEIWKQVSLQRQALAQASMKLWEFWLRLAPARLSARDRDLLGEFAALLRLISQSDGANQRLAPRTYSQYFKLFPSLTSMLSCWAVTSLSVKGRVPLEPGFFDLVVIDEASQCDIASALPLLLRAKAAVVIGDPKQLRHISGITPRRDRELLAKHGLEEGYAKWAYSENSLFDLASPLAGQDDVIMLRDHHRSHADIIEFSNQQFYEGRLRVATNYDRLRRPSRDAVAAKSFEVSYLSKFADYIDERTNVNHVTDATHRNLGPEYPSVAKPELVSDWERSFYKKLWEAGVKPIPQFAEEKFLLDFAVLDGKRKLNIEVDGERYHRDWNGELLRRDQLRNMRMIELGWDVMRFWVYQLRDDMPACIQRVQKWVNRSE